MQTPPMIDPVAKKDTEHLNLLVAFHFVMAGFGALGLLFVLSHYLLMNQVFNHPELWKGAQGGPPPGMIMGIMQWFYCVAAFLIISCGVLNLLSGIFIKRRKHRLFSLVVAGLNCLHLPLGTGLGIFTFIVLLRDSVKRDYDELPSRLN